MSHLRTFRRLPLSLPLALAVLCALGGSAEGRTAYVANQSSGSVSAIDMTTNQVVGGEIEVGSLPSAIAITPDGSRAYVANLGSESVSVIDTAIKHVVATIKVGAQPSAIAIAPHGDLAYVVDRLAGEVSVIDTTTNKVVGEIEVGGLPSAIAIRPGSRAYVADSASNAISVIDTATDSVLGTTAVGDNPVAIAIAPDGSRAYVANFGSDTVSAINTASDHVEGGGIAVGHAPSAVAIAPDSPRAYVANSGSVVNPSNTVSVIDTTTNQVVGGGIEVGAQPRAIAIAPDGSRAYVANRGSGGVSVIDTATNQVLGEVDVGTNPVAIAIAPDQPPSAALDASFAPVGAPVELDASASVDPDGKVLAYNWDFGDHETAVSTSPRVTHIYAEAGLYHATVRETDEEGCSNKFLFGGQTALCNGSALSTRSVVVEVLEPFAETFEEPTESPPTPLPPRRKPSNDFLLGGLVLHRTTGTATLRVLVSNPGSVVLSGRELKSARRTATEVLVELPVRPTGDAKRELAATGTLKLRARVTFAPAEGSPSTKARTLLLKQALR